MSMARAEGLDSANSQFFIMLQPNLGLDGNYTAIGRVISGMEYVDAIEKGEPPANPSKIIRATMEADGPALLVPDAAAATTGTADAVNAVAGDASLAKPDGKKAKKKK
jgi:cyclophilin family peptidyl-prolyl cis-trans isomerase